MKVANSAEFLTWEADLPTSGARMETRCFDSWYVGEFTKETIGLKGVPGLWTFGSPYSRGIFPAELRSRSYSGPGIAPDLERERSKAFIRLSKACVGSLGSLLYVLASASSVSDLPVVLSLVHHL